MVDNELDITFSFVITSFNRPDYLFSAVESVAHLSSEKGVRST